MAARYKFYVDWTNNGTFTDAGDDVTSRVLDGRTPLLIRYGRDQSRALSPTSPAEVNAELNNISRDYSPENTSSPLAGKVLPGRSVYSKATLTGVDYPLFAGQLDDFTAKPDIEDRSIDITCLDALGRLRGVQVSTELYAGIRTGEAIGHLLDAAGWSATARDLDVGATVMAYWWADAEDCFDAVMKLVASEGPPALITSDGLGNVVFRDRHHRLLRSASLTAQSTWYSAGSVEPVLSKPSVYNHGWKEIVNVLDFDVPQRRPSDPPSAVWNSQDRITLAAGETATLTARSSDPFYNAIVPVQDIDYTLVSGAPQITLTKLSGQSTTVTILAVGVAAIIDGLQVRATAVPTVTTVVLHAEDSVSIGTAAAPNYGRRSAPDSLAPVWANLYDAQAIQEVILARRADRVPTISVTLVNANNTRLLQQLTRDLSDLVRVKLAQIGLDADCFIEQIQHSIGQGGLEHRTTFGLEKAPTQPTAVFIIGSATSGVLGTNRLGKNGLDDPSLVFVLGSDLLGTNLLGH
jgi:hypothetical protein